MGWLKKSIISWLGLMGLALYATDKWVSATLFVTGLTALAVLDHINRGYWKKIGITQADGSMPIFGHLLSFMDTKHIAYHYQDQMYQKYKELKYVGSYILWSPSLWITDPEVIKSVTIKDFDHFVDRREIGIPESEKWSKDMLTMSEGARWKQVRSLLSPTFSSGKMKNMYPMVMEKADALIGKIHKLRGNGESTVDIKNLCGRLTVDVIGTCAFGIETNCIEDETAEFERKLAKASDQGIDAVLQMMAYNIAPKLAEYFDYTLFSRWRYFRKILENTIKERKNSTHKRGDFVDLTLEAKANYEENGSKKFEITEDTIVASAVIFLIAGYDTVANTLIIASHMIAQHPEEQEKLRQELREIVEQQGSLNYQGIMEAKYLEAIISETQRIYPLNFVMERKCTKEYQLPGTNIKLEKGRVVQVPVWSLQNDEKYWEEPNKFNPDRFLPENKANIVQGTFMPFGLGPRNCIAQRFAQMEVKIAIARLVQEFKLTLAPGREELALKKGPIPRPENTMPLVLTPVVEE